MHGHIEGFTLWVGAAGWVRELRQVGGNTAVAPSSSTSETGALSFCLANRDSIFFFQSILLVAVI